MQVLYQRCAAIDVGKDVIAVAVRLPGDGPDGRATVKRTFKTFYGVLARGRPVAGLARRHPRGDGGHRDLQHAGLPRADRARGFRAGAGVQRRACEERPGPQNRSCRRGVAGAPAGVRAAGGQLHPPGRDQGRPGRVPLPHQDRPAAGQRDRPARQRAAGRRDQDRLGCLLHRHQVRAGDDRGADRRGTPRPGPGRAGQGQDAVQDPGPVDGPGRPVRGPPRPDVPPAPGPHRPPGGDDRPAGRPDRGDDGALSRPAGPAGHHPRDRPARRRRGDLRDRRRASGSSSPPTPTWPPGPGCAPATTNRPANAAPASAARATSTCSPCWSSAPGPRSATTATSNPSTTGTS